MKELFQDAPPEVRFAFDAVEKAAGVAARIGSSVNKQSLVKRDRSPVTVADLAVQALVARLLRQTFPGDALVAEEESAEVASGLGDQLLESAAAALRPLFPETTPATVLEWIRLGEGEPQPKRFWTLDPIDGTKGFLRGEQYAVALALLVDCRPRLGVLGCPNLRIGAEKGILAVGIAGGGAWTTPLQRRAFSRLHVSGNHEAGAATVVRSVEAGHTDSRRFDRFLLQLGTSKPPVLMDSQAKYVLMAEGRGEVLVRMPSPARPGYREKIWDHAAGVLLVEEAGGRVTDLRGAELDFTRGRRLENNVGVIASNGALHELALEALASA